MALLTWALIFAVIALVAGVFGFGGVASAAAGVARILFFISIVIFLDLPDHRPPLAPPALGGALLAMARFWRGGD